MTGVLRSEITSVFRVAHVLLLRLVAGNMDVNTMASKRSELIRNTAIVRIRRVIYKHRPVSGCVCLRLSVAAPVYAETQGRKVRPMAGFTGDKTQELRRTFATRETDVISERKHCSRRRRHTQVEL